MTPDQERKQEDHIKSSHCERFRFTHLLQYVETEAGRRQHSLPGCGKSQVVSG